MVKRQTRSLMLKDRVFHDYHIVKRGKITSRNVSRTNFFFPENVPFQLGEWRISDKHRNLVLKQWLMAAMWGQYNVAWIEWMGQSTWLEGVGRTVEVEWIMVYGRFGDSVMIHNNHVIFTGGWTETTSVCLEKGNKARAGNSVLALDKSIKSLECWWLIIRFSDINNVFHKTLLVSIYKKKKLE